MNAGSAFFDGKQTGDFYLRRNPSLVLKRLLLVVVAKDYFLKGRAVRKSTRLDITKIRFSIENNLLQTVARVKCILFDSFNSAWNPQKSDIAILKLGFVNSFDAVLEHEIF